MKLSPEQKCQLCKVYLLVKADMERLQAQRKEALLSLMVRQTLISLLTSPHLVMLLVCLSSLRSQSTASVTACSFSSNEFPIV